MIFLLKKELECWSNFNFNTNNFYLVNILKIELMVLRSPLNTSILCDCLFNIFSFVFLSCVHACASLQKHVMQVLYSLIVCLCILTDKQVWTETCTQVHLRHSYTNGLSILECDGQRITSPFHYGFNFTEPISVVLHGSDTDSRCVVC